MLNEFFNVKGKRNSYETGVVSNIQGISSEFVFGRKPSLPTVLPQGKGYLKSNEKQWRNKRPSRVVPREIPLPISKEFQGPVLRADSVVLLNSGMYARLSSGRPVQPSIGESNCILECPNDCLRCSQNIIASHICPPDAGRACLSRPTRTFPKTRNKTHQIPRVPIYQQHTIITLVVLSLGVPTGKAHQRNRVFPGVSESV